ncbi:lipopolysaccharide kinase InaA family protein [Rhodocyclaceae bacterium SMB388]
MSFGLPDPLTRRFITANLSALVRGRLFIPGGHLPPAGHTVPSDFAGVGVATNADPGTDRQVIAHLRALGVMQVRLDYTYGDGDGSVARFLDALCAEGFTVMLHLLQPFDAARSMPDAAARAEWQRFVVDTLDRFGDRVELVEVCSTINRRRWAGYTLAGFVAAWRIAHDEIRRRGLILAGPSITDFEPPWTVGILALLRDQKLLPDIHTDNLFAERATEPERWDHKILGPRLAGLIRVNLIRKARLIARLGADAGVPRLMSPAAFWTLPRIERLLPDSEQKQADYLARYMVLCAASGALERACWGPLVCHREGLIDDGPYPYPALERITHYAEVTGTQGAFRARPAFDAMAAFNRLIPGCTYEGRLNDGQGLEAHSFADTTQRIHVVWTINARAAAACDLYDDADLDAARHITRDGHTLNHAPTLFTESPTLLRWPIERTVRVRPGAAPLPGLSIHRHGPLEHFYYRDADWHGMVLAASPVEADALVEALHPDRIGAPDRTRSLRHARNAIWTVDDPRTSGARLVVKQPVKHHLHKKLLDRFKPSKARRSWNGACELLRRGLATAPPVAWFEQRNGDDITRNWYVCEYVEGQLSVRELFDAYARGEPEHAGIAADTAYVALADFLLKLHGRGCFFRDLSGGNLLVTRTDSSALAFSLIDTARARFQTRGLPLRQRLSDLSRACHKLHPEGRRRFLTLYLGGLNRKPGFMTLLPLKIYDFKTWLKRKLRRTRIYKALKN